MEFGINLKLILKNKLFNFNIKIINTIKSNLLTNVIN